MTDRISLTGLQVQARHGVLPEEKKTPQLFVVDLDIFLDLTPSASADELSLTVDYGDLAERVYELVSSHSFSLLETLATKIADEALKDHPVERVVVTVHKPDAPIDLVFQDVAVTLDRSR